jgi:Sap-like sulfolipid-1-addressing protein
VGPLVGEVAALGLAVAVTSPVSVVTVIVLLSMPSGLRRAIAFVCGWLVALVGLGLLVVFVFHGQDFGSRHTTPSRAASVVEVVLGSVLFVWAFVAFRRRAPTSGGASTPKWLDRVEGTHWLLAVAVGAIMLSYALSLAAVSEILKANVSAADDAVAVAVFTLTSVTTVVAPIVVVVVSPKRSAQTLATWKAWLLGNSRAVVLVVLMIVAAFLVVRGVSDSAS